MDADVARAILGTMWTIRAFEERLAELIANKTFAGLIHVGIGQEATAAGVCALLRDDDYVYTGHRPDGPFIAKGADLARMMAELAGRATGYCRGKGGHMHLFDPVHKFSCSGIIGASLPPACGAALASKLRGRDSIAVSFFGEGATNQGAFHESLNLAALWKLPVVFVCEDNKWAISVPKSASTAIPSNADRAGAYGMPGVSVENNDAVEVCEAAEAAVDRARRGEGPTLSEVKTDRYRGHFQGDPEIYRPKGEVADLRKNDPIPRLAAQLREAGMAQADQDVVVARVKEEVAEAYRFAQTSPYPVPEEALQHVFV